MNPTVSRLMRWLFGTKPYNTRLASLLACVLLANIAAWILVLVVCVTPAQVAAALFAYGLGIRHAVDADHIAAIDGSTRKLVHGSRIAGSSGAFFALGHSTVVILLTFLAAMTTSLAQSNFGDWQRVGSSVGALASASFLVFISCANLLILRSLFRRYRASGEGAPGCSFGPARTRALPLGRSRVFARGLNLVKRPWHMYLVGLLFGFGFDTATQVALLGLSVSETQLNFGIWTIMVYPILFAAAMTLADTANSITMARIFNRRGDDSMRSIRFDILMTSASVVVGLLVASLQLVELASARSWAPAWLGSAAGLSAGYSSLLGVLIITIFLCSYKFASPRPRSISRPT